MNFSLAELLLRQRSYQEAPSQSNIHSRPSMALVRHLSLAAPQLRLQKTPILKNALAAGEQRQPRPQPRFAKRSLCQHQRSPQMTQELEQKQRLWGFLRLLFGCGLVFSSRANARFNKLFRCSMIDSSLSVSLSITL